MKAWLATLCLLWGPLSWAKAPCSLQTPGPQALQSAEIFAPAFSTLLDGHLAQAERHVAGKPSPDVCWSQRSALLKRLLSQAAPSVQRSLSYQILAGRFHVLEGRQDLAQGQFLAVIRAQPEQVYGRYHLAKMARAEGNAQAERAHLQAGLREVAASSAERAHQREMAERYVSLLNGEKALKFLEEGLWSKLAPHDPARARAYLELGWRLKNIPILEKGLEDLARKAVHPRDAADHSYYRGQLALLRGRSDEALSLFYAYYKDPDHNAERDAEVLAQLVPLFIARHQYIEARRLAEEALKRGFDFALFAPLQAQALKQGGLDCKQPIQDLGEALQVAPKSHALILERVEILLGARADCLAEKPYAQSKVGRRLARAHLDFLEGLRRLSPHELYYWRGRWAKEAGQKAAARTYFKTALKNFREEGAHFEGRARPVDLYSALAQASTDPKQAEPVLRQGLADSRLDPEDKKLLEAQLSSLLRN